MYLHTHVPTHKKTFCETAFLAALWIIAKFPKQPNCLPKGEWRNKLIYLYNTELLRKKNPNCLCGWIDLKDRNMTTRERVRAKDSS